MRTISEAVMDFKILLMMSPCETLIVFSRPIPMQRAYAGFRLGMFRREVLKPKAGFRLGMFRHEILKPKAGFRLGMFRRKILKPKNT